MPQEGWVGRDVLSGLVSCFKPNEAVLKDPEVWQMADMPAAFDPSLAAEVVSAFEAAPELFRLLERLPQTFSHLDASRGNLFFARGDLVAIDWASCGLGAVGQDLGEALACDLLLRSDGGPLERNAPQLFDAYLEGLRASGWRGRRDLAQAGYVTSATLRGLCMAMIPISLLLSGDRQGFRRRYRLGPGAWGPHLGRATRFLFGLRSEALAWSRRI